MSDRSKDGLKKEFFYVCKNIYAFCLKWQKLYYLSLLNLKFDYKYNNKTIWLKTILKKYIIQR